MLDFAKKLLDAGVSVIPIKPNSRVPELLQWTSYRIARATTGTAEKWWAKAGPGIAVVCGKGSKNVEMIDFDHDQVSGYFDRFMRQVSNDLPELVSSLYIESTPSGGRHIVYRCIDGIEGNKKLASKRYATDKPEETYGAKSYKAINGYVTLCHIETRGDGGYFVCAPTPDYAALQGELYNLPSITRSQRDKIMEIARSFDEVTLPTEPSKGMASATSNQVFGREYFDGQPGSEWNERCVNGDFRRLIEGHGWTYVRKTGNNEYYCRPGKEDGVSASFDGKCFFVFSSNAVPFESNKGYSPFHVYSVLEHNGNYRVAAKRLFELGYGAASVGTEDLSVLDHLIQDNKPDVVVNHGSSDDLGILTLRELNFQYPKLRPAIIQGLLRDVEVASLVADTKVGKTWLVMSLAMHFAVGAVWLDMFQCDQGKVLIFDNELDPETISFRSTCVREAYGFGVDQISDQIHYKSVAISEKDENIHTLCRMLDKIKPGSYRLIVIDAFYRLFAEGMDENSNVDMAMMVKRIKMYARKLECGFILVHHASKGSQAGKKITDVGSGGGALARAVDNHIIMRTHPAILKNPSALRDLNLIVLESAARSFPPVKPMVIKFERESFRHVYCPAIDVDDEEGNTFRDISSFKKTLSDYENYKIILGQGIAVRKTELAEYLSGKRSFDGKKLKVKWMTEGRVGELSTNSIVTRINDAIEVGTLVNTDDGVVLGVEFKN